MKPETLISNSPSQVKRNPVLPDSPSSVKRNNNKRGRSVSTFVPGKEKKKKRKVSLYRSNSDKNLCWDSYDSNSNPSLQPIRYLPSRKLVFSKDSGKTVLKCGEIFAIFEWATETSHGLYFFVQFNSLFVNSFPNHQIFWFCDVRKVLPSTSYQEIIIISDFCLYLVKN